jgi:RNA polymerase sigma-70 factor (ECF subfamily)
LETIGTIADASAQREQDGFEQLVALHAPRVRRLAHRLLGWRNASDVEDVVQDVFLAALEKLNNFRGDAQVSTWLTTITLNRCRTHRRPRLLKLKWLTHRDEPASDGQAIEDETSARVRQAVQELSAKDREVIVLFHLEEQPIAEIAKLLGAKANAIEVRLHRARQRLKETLGDLVND